jgi:hypothetical protein
MKRAGRSLAALLLLVILSVACLQTAPKKQVSSVAWLAETYGVSEQIVEDTARALGVDPEDTTDYGAGWFPANYFRERMVELSAQKGALLRDDLETLVKGYQLRCADTSGMRVYYLFYGTSVRYPQPFVRPSERAMVLRFVYVRQPATGPIVLDNWTTPDITDSGFDPDRSWLHDHCGIE